MIYLSARYDRIDEMHEKAEQLRSLGVEVGSRWHDHGPLEAVDAAWEDWDDVANCDIYILCTDDPPDTTPVNGGRYVELGIALAEGALVLLVGPTTNVFTHLADCRYATWEEVIAWLKLGQ